MKSMLSHCIREESEQRLPASASSLISLFSYRFYPFYYFGA